MKSQPPNFPSQARATRVEVTILREVKFVHGEVRDDGKSVQARTVLLARAHKHVGLLNRRKSVEMLGGSFQIESYSGCGTKIIAPIPASKATVNKWRLETYESNPQSP